MLHDNCCAMGSGSMCTCMCVWEGGGGGHTFPLEMELEIGMELEWNIFYLATKGASWLSASNQGTNGLKSFPRD